MINGGMLVRGVFMGFGGWLHIELGVNVVEVQSCFAFTGEENYAVFIQLSIYLDLGWHCLLVLSLV